MNMFKKVIFALLVTGSSSVFAVQEPIAFDSVPTEKASVVDKYQYIAEHLGLINKDKAFWRRLCDGMKAYKMPLSVITSAGVICLLVYNVKITEREKDFSTYDDASLFGWTFENISRNDMSIAKLGGMIGGISFVFFLVFYAFCEKLGNSIGSDSAMHRAKLSRYLSNWELHRENTPESFIPLFDKLHEFYVQNDESLKCDETFLESLLMTVSLAAIQNYADLR